MGYQIVRRLIPSRISNKYNRIKARLSLDDAAERLKGSKFEKIGNFWINLLRDYGEVIKDTSNGIKERPKRALIYAWGFWAWLYCVNTNPNERSFRDQCLSAATEISSLPAAIRNAEPCTHLAFLESCHNAGLLRRLNLGVCSVMWLDNYDKNAGLYAAHCKYLKPKYFSFHERILDYGMLGRWWVISGKMKDYDINPDEWKEKTSN
ncbi:hypothetical protein FOCC_FOCC016329 [Frankliniella occidentalis]|uniref:Mitochondrial import inner membrane translocase subunit Tim29 n=1 Tax=Frankliniella occidentalis TaxID=133901 RepID=A0A6J1TI79_FRAOC|nr:mitochondrial import inner membrane translocase subunit Tim29 [Frankliniella occidentalis]KAE8738200.1 hypothetical protein FOCC_FOCC016329 [Frankliniella occidentalis]